jgi:D-alanyl-D-alanine carboxypeptidase
MMQRSRLRRLPFVLLLLSVQVFLVGFGPPRLASRDCDPGALWPRQVQQMTHMAPPIVQSGAAVLVDVGSGAVLMQKNAGQHWSPASTTKMMTCLIALERGNLGDKVTVQAGDLAEASAIGLTAGEVWSLEDLLYALMLPSDNAVAVVVARHIAGSEASFVALMNDQAARWGLKDTHFANPHGLDQDGHYSSAYDLAQIAIHGLAQPVFVQIVSTVERQAHGRTLQNTNQLLGVYAGMQGVKTGTTDEAGDCLVSAAARPDGRAICVVLGSADRFADTRTVLDYYYANYVSVALHLGPRGFDRVYGSDGVEGVLVLREQRLVLLPRWQLPWLHVQPVSQPGTAGGEAGLARLTLGPALLAEMPLYTLAP